MCDNAIRRQGPKAGSKTEGRELLGVALMKAKAKMSYRNKLLNDAGLVSRLHPSYVQELKQELCVYTNKVVELTVKLEAMGRCSDA
jgi:hypothetical protein